MRRGFTILEIVTVLAVIGILAAVSLPIFQRAQPTLNLNSATRALASDLRLAQQLAVTEQIVYKVALNTATGSYTVVRTDTNQTIKTVNLDAQVHISNISGLTSDEAHFNATGAAVESGTITLTNSNGKTATIEIKPSGYVRIQN